MLNRTPEYGGSRPEDWTQLSEKSDNGKVIRQLKLERIQFIEVVETNGVITHVGPGKGEE